MEIKDLVGLWIAVISAICAAVAGIWRLWGRGKWMHWKRNRDAVRQLIEYNLTAKFDKVFTELSAIKYQLYPNGGNSLKDDVAAVLNSLAVTKGLVDATLYLDVTPTFKCDMKGNCFFVNVAWLELFGFTNPEEAYGKGWYRTIHPPDKEEVKQEFEEAVTNETIFIKDVKKQHLVTNTVIPVKMMTKVIRDHNRKAIEIIGQLKPLNQIL